MPKKAVKKAVKTVMHSKNIHYQIYRMKTINISEI